MNISQQAYKKSSFGPAFLFLSKRHRHALAVYYAFCRLVDDIADEADITDKEKQLLFWKEEIARIFNKQATTDLGKELEKIVVSFAMSRDCFDLLIEGMQADVKAKTYQTLEELNWYLWRVAGVVGLATLEIVGVKGSRAQALAQTLGNAVQVTNIIRDVYDDAQLKRVYLPLDMLAQQGLSREDLLTGKRPEALAAVLRLLSQKAHLYYRQAAQLMALLPTRKMLPCRVMACVYRANLAKIEKTDFQFSRTIKLTAYEKMVACVYALYQSIVGR